jgi:hypothetical protein
VRGDSFRADVIEQLVRETPLGGVEAVGTVFVVDTVARQSFCPSVAVSPRRHTGRSCLAP